MILPNCHPREIWLQIDYIIFYVGPMDLGSLIAGRPMAHAIGYYYFGSKGPSFLKVMLNISVLIGFDAFGPSDLPEDCVS